MTPSRVFVFDAYGTLFDVNSAVFRHADAVGPDAKLFAECWRAKQLEYTWVLSLAHRFEPFWALTTKALDFTFAKFPLVDRALRASLLDAYRTLSAYPEVNEVLLSLGAREVPTAILSNGDTSMLHDAIRSAGIDGLFDAVISVEAAGVFKTDPRVYALVTEAFAVAAGEIIFVSSNRWDVVGAAAFGLVPVWVNRTGAPDEYTELPPMHVVTDLRGLLTLNPEKSL